MALDGRLPAAPAFISAPPRPKGPPQHGRCDVGFRCQALLLSTSARERVRPRPVSVASTGRRLFAATTLAVAAGSAVVLANVGIATRRYGLEYLRRLAVWGRQESMGDPGRFPTRVIEPSAIPFRFLADPDGPERLRAAFRLVGGRHGAAGDEALEAFLRRTSLLVLAGDRLAYEGCFNGAVRGGPLTSMSMAKSVLALLVVAAIGDGRIASFDTPAAKLLPMICGLAGSGVTLRHLMHMASGLGFETAWPLHRISWPLLFDGARVAYFTPDIRATARPGGAPPGARFAYDDRSAHLVGLILERAAERPVSADLGVRLWRRIGAEYAAS